MEKRTEFLLLILEQIGLPLIQAVGSSSKDQSENEDATKISELLSRSTHFGADIGKALEFEKADKDSNSLRISLSAIAAQVVASQYAKNEKTPGDTDQKKLIAALESVLTYADQFTPDDESIARLKTQSQENGLFDGQQINLQYVHAMVPVINAVSEFSFGQTETKVLQDISDKLGERAKSLKELLFGSKLEENESKLAELALLRLFVDLYAQCHLLETKRIMSLEEAKRENVTMDAVWTAFEKRAQMLVTLAQSFIPAETQSSSQQAPETAPVSQEQQAPVEQAAQEQPQVQADTSASETPPAQPAAPETAAPPAEPANTQPETPAEPQQNQQGEQKAEQASAPPTDAANENAGEEKSKEDEKATGTGGGGGNPMAFFKDDE